MLRASAAYLWILTENNFDFDCAITCRSFCGFQSESKMMHVSAAVRLMPRPPALVQRRKTKRSESGLLKRSMAAWRRFPRTRPSIRSYKYLQLGGKKTIKLFTYRSDYR